MDESIDISDVLSHALHPDDNIRSIAEGKIKQLHGLDLPNFLLHLSSHLLREGSPEESRTLAGIILKNSLESRDPTLKDTVKDLPALQWLSLDPSIRSEIKENLLMALESDSRQSDSRRPSSKVIAKVIARVACIEIPRNQWQDLIGKLVDNMARTSSSLKEATLEVLEYVFEETPYVFKGDQGDVVKASVVNAVKNHAGELSSQIRLAAVKALLNVVQFAEFARFKDHARNSIVAAVCEAAGSNQTEIKEVAFECLVAIASRYHTNLEPYKEIILSLTTQALKGDVESLKVQSIELWSTICQTEIDCREEEEEEEQQEQEQETSSFIGPLSSFVPLLLETYLKEEEDLKQEDISMSAEHEGDDNLEDMDISVSEEQEGDENVERERVNLEDNWGQEGDETVEGIYMTCLGLAARTMKDAVVPLVMQFVECNINGPHCHSRKVAISPLAFILEGPSVKQLAPVVHLLLDMMKDPEEGVRGRAAWTLGLVFELVGANRIIRNEGSLPQIMAILIERSKDVPQVSIEVYRALYFLVRGYGENAKSKSKSCELSPFVKPLIDSLLCASELAKETPFRLPACTSAYEALSEIVRVCNIQELEVYGAVVGLMSLIIRRLNIVLNRHGEAVSSIERKNRSLLEVLLCGLLELLIRKLGSSYLGANALKWSAKTVLLLLCCVLTRDSSSARDGAAIAIGALAHAIGGDFGQHMPILLQHFNVKRLSPVYLEVMCGICRVLGKEEEVVPSYDHIMEVLYQGILESTLQPSILSSFGKIALAIGEKFEKYLPLVMEKLRVAAELKSEDKDHGNKVREGIFKAYGGILGGINDPKSGMKVAIDLVDFTEGLCKDHDKTKTSVWDRKNTSVTKAGIDALSQLPSRVGAWSQGLIELMKE